MEEILASIRKIISEDAPADAPAAQASAPAPEPEVLELTQEIVEMQAPEPPPAPAPADDIVFQADPAPAPAPASSSNDIFSDRTRQALDNAFASIPEDEPEPAPAQRATAAPLPQAHGATIESVFERAVRDSFDPVLRSYLTDNNAGIIEGMKPLIREWMDQNFPALLENAVRTEIERVVRSRRR
jgi:hypothetical protein